MLSPVFLALRTRWVFLSHSLHYTEQPDHKKAWTQGKSELAGADIRSVQGPERQGEAEHWAVGNDGKNPGASLAAPLGPSGHLLAHTAATGRWCHLCALGGGHLRSPLGCCCVTVAAALGASGCAVPCSPSQTKQSLEPGALLLTAAACKESLTNFGQPFVGVRTPSPVFGWSMMVICAHWAQLVLQALTQPPELQLWEVLRGGEWDSWLLCFENGWRFWRGIIIRWF